MAAVFAQSEGINLLRQALAYRHGLVQGADLPASQLSDAMPFLIQVLARQADALDYACQQLSAGADDVWEAAVAYFKHVCFIDAKDSYRVLGLSPWSTPAQIKARYRQLIRLFHPDRGLLSRRDQEQDFAALINDAYKALTKDAAAATSWSADARQGSGSNDGKVSASARKTPRQSYMARMVSGLGLYRFSPSMIWLVLTLFAVTFVAERYWQNRNSNNLLDNGDYQSQLIASKAKIAPAPAKVVVAVSDAKSAAEEMPAETEVVSGAVIGMVPADNAKPEAGQPDAPPAVKPEVVNTNALQPAPSQPPAKLPVAAKLVAQPVPAVKKEAAKPVSVKAEVAVAQPPQPAANNSMALLFATTIDQKPKVTAVVAATDAAAESQRIPAVKGGQKYAQLIRLLPERTEPSEAELDALIQRFVSSYNQGNLESLMLLLDETVETDEPGGKAGLQTAYARLFNKSQAREMQLKPLTLQHQGDAVLAITDYQVSVLMTGKSEPRYYRGSLRIEVARIDGDPRVIGFYNFPERVER